MTNSDPPASMDEWLRRNAHRRRITLEDIDRPATPSATTNDRRGLLERLLDEAQTETGTDER